MLLIMEDQNDPFMLSCIREIAWVAAQNQILLQLRYIKSCCNTLPDTLSCWYISSEARHTVKRLTDRTWIRRLVSHDIITFHSSW